MKVRSGTSLWRIINPELISVPRLEDDVLCEVVIVGGGVSGALVAHRLVGEGVDTVLLDKQHPAAGSTAASTGLLQYEIDTPLARLISKVGQASAVHAYRRGLTAIDEIAAIVAELGDPCGFERRDCLYFASSNGDYRDLKREFDCRLEHGFDVRFAERTELKTISSIDAPGAIISRGDGQIDPYRFTQLVLANAQAQGLRIFAGSNVQDVDESGDLVIATTEHGRVTARRIVYATGYESQKYLNKKIGSLHSTYAAASEPIGVFSGWPDRCLIWETARPYFYARQTEDGRVVIGGEDTKFSTDHQRDDLVERQLERLVDRFHCLFPALHFEPACAWAGTFGETKDGLAYIGQPPDRPLAFFAIGYGGNGITFSMIAAKLITDLYVGRANEDAAVFGFDR